MPKKLEKVLRKKAKEKFPNDKERQDRYVYGALQNLTDWQPSRKKKHKGKRKG